MFLNCTPKIEYKIGKNVRTTKRMSTKVQTTLRMIQTTILLIFFDFISMQNEVINMSLSEIFFK